MIRNVPKLIPQYMFYGRLGDQLSKDRMVTPTHNFLVILKTYLGLTNTFVKFPLEEISFK